jgi:hypothetical protein
VIYFAVAELAVILLLVLLREHDKQQEITTILGIMDSHEERERELLNAARNPGYIIPARDEAPEIRVSDEQQRVYEENLARIGKVE